MDLHFIGSTPPPAKLAGFKNYNDFLNYSQSLFDLAPDEHQGLYAVLLKLQSLGEDPLATMASWKNSADADDCLDLIRFMIAVDSLPLEDMSMVA